MKNKSFKRTLASAGQSLLTALASVGLSLLTAFLSLVLGFALGGLLGGDHFPLGEEIGEGLLYVLWGIILAVPCYFICRGNPRSIWYAPILCNIIGINFAFTDPNFWITPMWIGICGGWVLSIIGAIAGAKAGKKG